MKITIELSRNELKDLLGKIKRDEEPKEEKEVKRPVASMYARFFDGLSSNWVKDPEQNMEFLKTQQDYANDMLKSRGYLFLNDVYQMLGLPKNKAGQTCGWIYRPENPIGDNYIDFDIFNICNKDFVNGKTNVVLLDFNVDGNILG